MLNIDIKKQLNGQHGAFELNVHVSLEEGSFVALYGPSGVGKTTLLQCLAGLTQAQTMNIQFKNQIWADTAAKINLSPQSRKIAYMFQDNTLFPNMTVRENISFGLRKGGNKKMVNTLIEMMDLGELQHHKPEILSGGQKQRTALARTLVSEPCLMLLDEPFSALDAETCSRLQTEILRMQKQAGITTIIVSHHVGEIYKLSSRVLKMQKGKIVEDGDPVDVLSLQHGHQALHVEGKILAIAPVDDAYLLTVLADDEVMHITSSRDEAANFNVDESVLLVAKASNLEIKKLEG